MTLYNFAVSYGEPRHSLRSAYRCKKVRVFRGVEQGWRDYGVWLGPAWA